MLTIVVIFFYWMIGSSLENEWGSFKFNIYYFCGLLGTIAAGMFTGYATNGYLNLSLYFAFAILNPNTEIRLMLILPVKVKYLAAANAALFAAMFIVADWQGKITLIVSLLNLILFFWRDFIDLLNNISRRMKWKRDTRRR